MAIHSMEIGKGILDALGIAGKVTWFELRCAVDEAATVTCEILPDNYDGDKIKSILKRYQLTERKPQGQDNADP
jgi:hypothetical protein